MNQKRVVISVLVIAALAIIAYGYFSLEKKKIVGTTKDNVSMSFHKIPCSQEDPAPCVNDLTALDKTREAQALSLLQTKFGDLRVSSDRYEVIERPAGLSMYWQVVDLYTGEVTDVIRPSLSVANLPDRIIFVNRTTSGEEVRQYIYGTAKSFVIANSQLTSPQTYSYAYDDGAMGLPSFEALSIASSSITLGIYDASTTLPKIPGDYFDFVRLKQVGTTTISL